MAMTSKTKKIIKTVIDVVLWVFLAFAVIMTIFAFLASASGGKYPKFGDKCILTVGSNSMEAETGFYKGDIIISKALTDPEKIDLQVGDVITFLVDLDGDGEDELNTHRIIEVVDTGTDVAYRTKGDNPLATVDAKLVDWDKVEALWTGKRIAGIGYVISFLQTSTGFLVCIVVPILLIFIYQLVIWIKTFREVKGKGKRTITEAEEEEIKRKAVEEFLAKQAQANTENTQTDKE